MNKEQFWQLIEAARNQASNPNDGEAVARRAASQLATHPAEEIVAVKTRPAAVTSRPRKTASRTVAGQGFAGVLAIAPGGRVMKTSIGSWASTTNPWRS
ncbi:DUF4240 domain-containing protein [Streptomyces sp. NPDC056161]|uniref:DUF4240 domain-containing protein n=1 Tax=Streptomyces sp. NPDC056161 TaxID=3345732 RepID=UPI0035D80632